jgi:hypothetical protein
MGHCGTVSGKDGTKAKENHSDGREWTRDAGERGGRNAEKLKI